MEKPTVIKNSRPLQIKKRTVDGKSFWVYEYQTSQDTSLGYKFEELHPGIHAVKLGQHKYYRYGQLRADCDIYPNVQQVYELAAPMGALPIYHSIGVNILKEPTLNEFEQLKALPSNSVDITFTDPPYGIGKKYQSGGYNDNKNVETYLEWAIPWLTEVIRVTKPTGHIIIALWSTYAGAIENWMRYNHGGKFHIDYPIIWKNDARPAAAAKRLANDYTPLIHFSGNGLKGDDRRGYTYRGDDARTYDNFKGQARLHESDIRGKIPGTIWNWSKKTVNTALFQRFSDLMKGTIGVLLEEGGTLTKLNNLWDIAFVRANAHERFNHPCQMPVELPARALKLFSRPGDVVLDPFNGTATTGIACLKTGRQYIGVDISDYYLHLSHGRLNNYLDKAADVPEEWQTVTADNYEPEATEPSLADYINIRL
jgi:site-specific DNA-methyltransferase (adenine-specific)